MNMSKKMTTVGLIAGVALGLSGVLTSANAANQTLPEDQQQSSNMEHQNSMEHQKNMKTMHKKASHEHMYNKSMKPKLQEPAGAGQSEINKTQVTKTETEGQ